jgi:2-polyprenyl-3-methyl-5-hydroxy-6-metoxy-1,4-benzoquinol methylase
MTKTLVFTATYNESDNIVPLVESIFAELPSSEVLVVDDNSPDGTGRLLETLQEDVYPDTLHVVIRPRKLGVGSAHKLAVKFALAHGFERLITMDADFSHDPKYLPLMADLLEGNDFVIGSRYVEGGSCEYGRIRRWFSRSANGLARLLLHIPLKETTTSYRGFRGDFLERLDVDSIRGDGYSYFVGCAYRAARLSDSLAEFPIVFVDRRAGSTKISQAEIVKGFLMLLRLSLDRARGRSGTRPSHVAHDAPGDLMPCNACGSVYHVEKYPASVSTHVSTKYNCTSMAHASHGRIVRCLGCGLVFTNPQLPENEVTSLYAQVEDPTYLSNVDARDRTFTYNLGKILPLLPQGGRLLDVGSYTGTFLQVARKHGFDVMGVEPSVWAARYANETLGVPTVQGTSKDIPPEAGRFDVVCSWDVLEHMSDPMAELRRINELTELHGLFSFSTLNFDSWPPRVLGERWPWMMDMHLYYFNEKIIEDMLRRTGFELKHVGTYCHIITAEYLMGKLQSLGIPGAGLALGAIRRTPLKRAYIPFRFGDIQLFVAEKTRELSSEFADLSLDRLTRAQGDAA